MRSTMPYERLMGRVLHASPSSAFLLASALSDHLASSSDETVEPLSAPTAGSDPEGTLSSPSQTGVLQAWLSENMSSLSQS